MTPIEKATLESLQFLISMKKPNSEQYQTRQAEIMTTNHLLLYPITEEETCCEMPEEEIVVNVSKEVNKNA